MYSVFLHHSSTIQYGGSRYLEGKAKDITEELLFSVSGTSPQPYHKSEPTMITRSSYNGPF